MLMTVFSISDRLIVITPVIKVRPPHFTMEKAEVQRL